MSQIGSLPKISTKKQFMDTLSRMNTPTEFDEEDGMGVRGRPRDLKSYLFEANEELTPQFEIDKTMGKISDTGLDNIKILTMNEQGDRFAQFYLDISDKRFLILHTNALAKDTHHYFKKLTQSNEHEFDSAWFSTTMLKEISSTSGNRFYGYGVDYTDIFREDSEDIEPKDDLRMNISGTISQKVLETIRQEEAVERTMGYTKVTIGRGSRTSGVLENLEYDGKFRVMRGDSVDDHISLVEYVKDKYSQQVHEIEKERIRGEKIHEKSMIEGTAFDFEFVRTVDNWDKYLKRIFNAMEPFRIWGIKSKIDDGVYRVLGVDMHTGDPLDVEISDNLMRVYLPKNSCGNVVLRLFANLQRFFDSKIHSAQID